MTTPAQPTGDAPKWILDSERDIQELIFGGSSGVQFGGGGPIARHAQPQADLLRRAEDALLRARQHVPANAVDAKAALTRPREECRTLTEIDAVLAELRRVKEDI